MVPGEIERYVSEAARVLKPGGRLLKLLPDEEESEERLDASYRWVLGQEQPTAESSRSSHPAALKARAHPNRSDHIQISSSWSGTSARYMRVPALRSRAFATGNGPAAGGVRTLASAGPGGCQSSQVRRTRVVHPG